MNITCVARNPDALGECPLWDDRDNRLLWIDSLSRRIHSLDPASGERARIDLPERVGSIGLRERGGLVVALKSGFHVLDPDSGELALIVDPEPDVDGTRLNDGKCDRRGRYWCGSMDESFAAPIASLYRLDPDGVCHRMKSGITVSNGIAFSPDERTLFFSDSRVERYFLFDLDPDTGVIGNCRTWIEPGVLGGRIDGATVDAGGNYWCALFKGAAVACIHPDGTLLRRIELPVRYPTMCRFGGENFDVLYVTSATSPLARDALNGGSLDGGLFAVTGTGARGLPEPRFAG